MMRRLRDEGERCDPNLSAVAELLAQARPHAPDASHKRRVRARLLATVERRAIGALPVGALLVGSALSLALAIGSLGCDFGRSSSTPDASDGLASSRSTRTRTTAWTTERSSESPSTPTPAARPTDAEKTATATRRAPLATKSKHPRARGSSETFRTAFGSEEAASGGGTFGISERAVAAEANAAPHAPSEDAALLVEATRLLRQAREPGRAIVYLEEYLRRFPDGALYGEALGLAIEAATVDRDPRAARFASRYLERFPQGRFAAAALRAKR